MPKPSLSALLHTTLHRACPWRGCPCASTVPRIPSSCTRVCTSCWSTRKIGGRTGRRPRRRHYMGRNRSPSSRLNRSRSVSSGRRVRSARSRSRIRLSRGSDRCISLPNSGRVGSTSVRGVRPCSARRVSRSCSRCVSCCSGGSIPGPSGGRVPSCSRWRIPSSSTRRVPLPGRPNSLRSRLYNIGDYPRGARSGLCRRRVTRCLRRRRIGSCLTKCRVCARLNRIRVRSALNNGVCTRLRRVGIGRAL